jgi:hypothetical protein
MLILLATNYILIAHGSFNLRESRRVPGE